MNDEFHAKTASNEIISRHLPSEDTKAQFRRRTFHEPNLIRRTLFSLNQNTSKCQRFSGKVKTACKIRYNKLCIKFGS